MLASSYPKVAAMPSMTPWRSRASRNDVVGVFPNPAALLRLCGEVLVERHDEGEAGDRPYCSESSMLEFKTINNPTMASDEVERFALAQRAGLLGSV